MHRVRETVNGNPTPNNTIYNNLEEEGVEEQEENACHNQEEIIPDFEQVLNDFQKYTAIELNGLARKKTYLKWREEWGFT